MDVGSVIWVIILSLAAILIFFSNLCIFIAVYKSRKLRNRGNIFILCLASSDFLVSVFNVPFTAVSVVYPALRETGSTLCDVSGFFEMTILIASVFSVTAINVHRYIYIVFWTKYYEILRKDRIIASILCLWLSAIFLSAPPLINLSKIAYKSGKSHCFVDWKVTPGYTFSLILICFLMPIIVMGYCYYKIYTFRRKSRKVIKTRLTNQENASDRKGLAVEERTSNKSYLERNDARGGEHKAAAKTIAKFLNESIKIPGDHIQVEMQDLMTNSSKITVDEGIHDQSGCNYGESSMKDGCGIEDKASMENTLREMQIEDPIEKTPQQLLKKQRRRSRMLRWKPCEPKIDESNATMPKNTGMCPKQKYQGASDRKGRLLGHRKIEVLVEESVSSSNESHIPGNTEYSFQVCATEETESRETYVVQRTKRKGSEDLKLTMMCVIIVAVFFISWFPFVVTMLIESLTELKIPSVVDRATLLIGYLNSLSNPIIYCYFNKNFRTQLKKIICRKWTRKTAYLARS